MHNPYKSSPQHAVYLCGAGISAPPPSNLATVEQFLKELAILFHGKTKLSEQLINRLIYGNEIYNKLRFEQIIASMLEFDQELHCLDYLKISDPECQKPNQYHMFLAQELLLGATIITTNFDAFIEVALLDIASIDISEARGKLLKLHGSLQSTKNGNLINDSSDGLKADIFSVSAGNPISADKGSLDDLLSIVHNKILYVLGYSFNDSYDVTPFLKKTRPKRAIVFDYIPEKTEFTLELTKHTLEGFKEIQATWNTNDIEIEVWIGNPSLFVEDHCPYKTKKSIKSQQAKRRNILPKYNREELIYLAGKISVDQDALNEANPLFKCLLSSKDKNINYRSFYYYLRTLEDWSDMLALEKEAVQIAEPNYNGSLIYILLLNAASFLGPGNKFRKIHSEFRQHLGQISPEDPEQKIELVLGKSLHCIGNYFLNTGRPKLAEAALYNSLQFRTKHGSPTDVAFAEYGICLSLLHQEKNEEVKMRLQHFRDYAKKNDNISSSICLETLEGLYLLNLGSFPKALAHLEEARTLYMLGEDENQIDPETEFYILSCMSRLGYSKKQLKERLEKISAFVVSGSYSFFYEPVQVFRSAFSGKREPRKMGEFARSHANRAGLWNKM